jgi:mono/diheme cytochrome c family protein
VDRLTASDIGGEGVMVPMGANSDEWIADVASYIRNSFGNTAQIVRRAGCRACARSARARRRGR